MTIRPELLQGIITECRDDYVGLWVIVRAFQDAGITDGSSLMDETLTTVAALLAHEDISAGQFDHGQFEVWSEPTDTIVERIRREWVALGCTPSIGDIVWFAGA
jgi:hypothetical protein